MHATAGVPSGHGETAARQFRAQAGARLAGHEAGQSDRSRGLRHQLQRGRFTTRLSGGRVGRAQVWPTSHRSYTIPARSRAPTTISALDLRPDLQAKRRQTITNTAAYDPNYKIPYCADLESRTSAEPAGSTGATDQLHRHQGHAPGRRPGSQSGSAGTVITAAERLPITNANVFTYYETAGNSDQQLGPDLLAAPHAQQPRLPAFLYPGEIHRRRLHAGVESAVYRVRACAFHQRSPRPVSFTFTAESPVDQRKGFLANKGFLTKSLKNWTLQAPITWSTGTAANGHSDRRYCRNRTCERAASRGHGLPVDSGSGFFNTAAFAIPASGTFGNAGRDTIPGPDTFTMNANMSRTIQLKGAQEPGNSDQLDQYSQPPRSVRASAPWSGRMTFGVLPNVGGMRTISGTIRFRM